MQDHVGHAEKWDMTEIDDDIVSRNCTAAYYRVN